MVDTVQPQGLLKFQKPIGVVATIRRCSCWDGTTQDPKDHRARAQNRAPRIADRGWKSGNISPFRSREKYFSWHSPL